MRFEDWDVLLFPKDSKIPMKEFKTNCHVVHDTEFAYTHGSYGLPTMTCFMPGLSPGTPFNISLHCWKTPETSQFTRNYSKHPELVKFEARVLIDGRLVASSSFNRSGPWPQLINHSFEFTKNGDLEVLKFPQFRSELLRQSYWSPADEFGRIKIVISEGFPRDSLTVPIERVKNIIAFSFQHAPLDILETSGIAWPNPAMWRRGPFNPTMPVPTQQHEDGPDAHLHSPRRRTTLMRSTSSSGMTQANTNQILVSMPNTQALLQRSGNGSGSGYTDLFNQQKSDVNAYIDWTNNFGPVGYSQTTESGHPTYNPAESRKPTGISRVSNSDSSMPDYILGTTTGSHHVPEFQHNFQSGNIEDPDTRIHGPKVPTNTPTALADANFVDDFGIDVNKIGTPGNTPPTNEFFGSNTSFSSELATSLTHSLLNQPHPLPVGAATVPLPASEVKSRKENRFNHHESTPAESTPTAAVDSHHNLQHNEMRKVSQPAFSNVSKESREPSSNVPTNNTSPHSQRSFSGIFSHRSTSRGGGASGGEFGYDLTNVVHNFSHHQNPTDLSTTAAATATSTSTMGGGNNLGLANTADVRIGSGSEKSMKRTRHFTPASARAIDDEDEPRRSSPRIRFGLGDQFGES
ncbi:hypothetical protein F4809DRAFT_253633 [Biscogniauxia mediterranea]|nr:hypothetical protein F4809DRAFT_253633 [Biscogniauxia mediterranea]